MVFTTYKKLVSADTTTSPSYHQYFYLQEKWVRVG